MIAIFLFLVSIYTSQASPLSDEYEARAFFIINLLVDLFIGLFILFIYKKIMRFIHTLICSLNKNEDKKVLSQKQISKIEGGQGENLCV